MSFTEWKNLENDEIFIPYGFDEIARAGGFQNWLLVTAKRGYLQQDEWTDHFVQGINILNRWCRVNCKSRFRSINVRGQFGWAFRDASEALLFKLTWVGI